MLPLRTREDRDTRSQLWTVPDKWPTSEQLKDAQPAHALQRSADGASWAQLASQRFKCGGKKNKPNSQSYLGLVVRHLLDQRLTGELLRAAGEVLGRVGGAGRHDRGPRRGRRVHHGGRAWRVVLV